MASKDIWYLFSYKRAWGNAEFESLAIDFSSEKTDSKNIKLFDNIFPGYFLE